MGKLCRIMPADVFAEHRHDSVSKIRIVQRCVTCHHRLANHTGYDTSVVVVTVRLAGQIQSRPLSSSAHARTRAYPVLGGLLPRYPCTSGHLAGRAFARCPCTSDISIPQDCQRTVSLQLLLLSRIVGPKLT